MEKDKYNLFFKTSTSMAGCLLDGMIKKEINSFKEKFGETIEITMFDEKSVYIPKFDTAIEDGQMIDFYLNSEQDRGKYPATHFDLAFLLPYHNLAFITSSFILDNFKEGEEFLKQKGYVCVDKQKESQNYTWTRAQPEILACLRSPELPFKAVDARVYQILYELLSNLPDSVEFLNFAVHTPESGIRRIVKMRKDCVEDGLEKLCKGLPLANAVALTSIVDTSKGIRHIPLFSFNYDFNRFDFSNLKGINIPGMLVKTYPINFCGFELMKEDERMAFLKDIPYKNKANFHLEEGDRSFSMLRLTPARNWFSQPCLYALPKIRNVGKEDYSVKLRKFFYEEEIKIKNIKL